MNGYSNLILEYILLEKIAIESISYLFNSKTCDSGKVTNDCTNASETK